MRLLLDTHALLFWISDPSKLGPNATRAIKDRENEILWSIASTWEVSIKVGLGKLVLPGPVDEVIPEELNRHGFTLLPIEHAHVMAVAKLPMHHRDPFDRLLVAQTLTEKIPLVSADATLDAYGINRLW